MLEDIRDAYDSQITDAECIRAALADALEMQQAQVSSPTVSNEVIEALGQKGGSVEAVVRVEIAADEDDPEE